MSEESETCRLWYIPPRPHEALGRLFSWCLHSSLVQEGYSDLFCILCRILSVILKAMDPSQSELSMGDGFGYFFGHTILGGDFVFSLL